MKAKEVRRQYFCICEGQQEEMYLKKLSCLLRTDKRRVTFTTTQGLPGNILKQNHIIYDKAVLFDHDGKVEDFRQALSVCIKAKCAYAYSNRNFDLWLLLHKREFTRCVSDNKAYVDDIREVFNLGKEADIKSKKVLERILEQITLSDVKTAIRHAKRIREQKLPGDAEKICDRNCYNNPDLSIHEFIIKVFLDCSESL